ncbi:hypothetical protein ST47_g2219 [Ascochyta rabiei]|uniref:Uncharacterized protein n=1 Tax=Didymella rabiei TaxID=5454 RepID=A0A163JTF1_DIDRA|nr:hypothetical protein ST47_g2219 [Ascochyta rabiei]
MSSVAVVPKSSLAFLKKDKPLKAKQNSKQKEDLAIKEKRNIRCEDSEASDTELRIKSKGKGKARAKAGEGVEEVDSDALPAEEESDAAVSESELSSHIESESDEGADEESRSARREKKAEEKHARRKARGKEYYDQRDAADKREAAITANEGFSNYMSQRMKRTAPEKRPVTVEKEWRGLYPLLKFLWVPGGKATLSETRFEIFKRANENIERYCNQIVNVDVEHNTRATALYLVRLEKLEKELAGQSESTKVLRRKRLQTSCAKEAGQPTKAELLKKWKFPTEELTGQIYSIEKALAELDLLPSEAAYNKKIAEFNQQLAVSSSSRKAAKKTAKKNAILVDKKAELEKQLASRKNKKMKLFQTALIFLDNLQEKGIPPTQVLSNRAETVFHDLVSSSRENLQLYNALKEEMERPTLEQLDEWNTAIEPMCNFVSRMERDDMVTEQSIAEAGVFFRDLDKINQSIAVLGENDNSLPMSILKEIFEKYQDGHQRQVKVSIARLMDELRRQEAAVGVVRAIELGEMPAHHRVQPEIEPPSSPATANPIAKSTVTPPTGATAVVANSITGTSHITGTNLSEDVLRNLDITSMTLGPSVTEMFQYEDGMTEHGPLIATRVGITDNARLNRYFVNAGLDAPDMEYLKVLKGSDLGPGGAEQLADQKVVNFDIKQRKKDIKGDHPIRSIGPVVVMPRAEGYVRRGVKERRQDAYIKVVYKDVPEPDMLSRTEFTQLVGQRFGEKQFSNLIGIYEKRQLYFEACKVQKLHPKTKQPLTSDDLQQTPWLFPENERNNSNVGNSSNSMDAEDSEDDEDPLQGVEIVTGALPADMTDPFKKPRAHLVGSSRASSSSQL